MYKVLLAEDEPPIMRTLKTAVERANPDFKVEKCCINGKQAAEALKNERFDVVITDIKMPVMSGIELAKWIYENSPKTLVVLLSGYREFDYARSALEYKVFDYILKPASKEKVAELLQRISAELEKGRAEPPMPDGDNISAVILVCAGAYLLYGTDSMLAGEQFWSDDIIEGFMSSVLKPDEAYVSFYSNFRSERFFAVDCGSLERQERIVADLYEYLRGRGLPITVMYKTGVKFRDAGKCFSELREHMIKKLVLGRSGIICCNASDDAYSEIVHTYSKEDIDAVVRMIKNGDIDSVRNKLKEIFDSMQRDNCTQEEVNGLLNLILDTYTLNYPDKIKRKNSSVKREFIATAASFTTYEALADDAASILMTLRADIKADRYEALADEVEQFIKSNYSKNITSETLSRKFGFVPSYISRLFKKHKGVSPSEYLTEYRIEQAKKILEGNSEIMIKEVADMVGFKEAYYFSKTFKRETGMWPTEFIGKARSEKQDGAKV